MLHLASCAPRDGEHPWISGPPPDSLAASHLCANTLTEGMLKASIVLHHKLPSTGRERKMDTHLNLMIPTRGLLPDTLRNQELEQGAPGYWGSSRWEERSCVLTSGCVQGTNAHSTRGPRGTTPREAARGEPEPYLGPAALLTVLAGINAALGKTDKVRKPTEKREGTAPQLPGCS